MAARSAGQRAAQRESSAAAGSGERGGAAELVAWSWQTPRRSPVLERELWGRDAPASEWRSAIQVLCAAECYEHGGARGVEPARRGWEKRRRGDEKRSRKSTAERR